MNKFKNNIQGNFTIIPNQVTNDPNLSWKAKGIFAYLASKSNDWNFYMEEIQKNSTDGRASLQSGIKELEENNYLTRKRNRNEGKIVGWIWILDIPVRQETNLTGNHPERKPSRKDFGGYSNTNNSNKENNNKDIKLHSSHSANGEKSDQEKDSSQSSKKKPTAKERTKKYIPLAKYLAKVIRSHIDYDIDLPRIKKWARDLRLLHEQNKVHPKRQKKVLQWYRKNIGGDYIPEAFSGSAFREKFPKLEAAIKRQKNPPTNGQAKPSGAYRRKDGYKYKTEAEIE